MAPLRILIIEDFEDYRRWLRATLQQNTRYEVVGEGSDGLKAVQQAKDLQPDLILLDIGLPTLNGLEAARQIVRVSPTSKLLFVSGNSSPEIASEALSLGAHGYLLKSDGAELHFAIDQVLQGRQFLSHHFEPCG